MATHQSSQHTEEKHVEEDFDEKVKDGENVGGEKKIVLAIESDAPKTVSSFFLPLIPSLLDFLI